MRDKCSNNKHPLQPSAMLLFVLTFSCACAAVRLAAKPEGWSRFGLNNKFLNFGVNETQAMAASWPENRSYKDVRTNAGVVRGHLRKEPDGDYYAFLGIPYAAPPTGSNRFIAPLPPKPWLNLLYANREVQCPQQGIGDEDCLVVNVFVPTVISKQMPVLVYIHGGSFVMGSGPTKGLSLLVKQNLVVVTLNYRLGVLGFLCLGIDDAPGNAGLKDQTAALQWVKRNIRQFGGDPNQVTLYGMSAGAASVHYHVLSGMSDGLFHKAIIESGSATSVWAVDPEPINTAKNFANTLDPPTPIRNLEELVRFLKRVPADVLSEENYRLYQYLVDGRFGFVPCVENTYNTGEAFIFHPPLEVMEMRNYTEVPIMFLYTSLEGLYLRSPEYYELDYKNRMNEDFSSFIPADLDIDRGGATGDPVIKKIKREYFGMKGIVDDEHLIGYLNYFGDYLILHGLLNSAEKHAESHKPVYLMEFAYSSDRGSFEKFYEYLNIAGHGDLARNVISTKPTLSRSDKLAVNRLSRLLANFVKFGNPTPRVKPLLPVQWPRVKPGNLKYLYMDQQFSVRHGYDSSRKRFWDDLYSTFRKPVKAVNPLIFM